MAVGKVRFRLMTTADVGSVPIDHQGTTDEVLTRIDDLGSSAVLAFDADQHVGQLQFRRYAPGLRSPHGLLDPLYWGDFADAAVPALPEATLNVFCYHVGQLKDGEERDARYQGRGVGLKLLDAMLDWARSAGFEAVVAKAVPPYRPVAVFMGGQPTDAYEGRGFQVVSRWRDAELRELLDRMLAGERSDEERDAIQALVDRGDELDAAAEVALCVKRF